MADPKKIENAIRRVRNQKSFIQELLIDALGWDIDQRAEDVEDITFEWSAEELRANDLDKHIVDGTIRQIRPFKGNPWGIFILEFRNPDVFATGRGMTGTLRNVLRGLVPSKKKRSTLASFRNENLLFICNHDYKHYRFAHFKTPDKNAQTAPLAAFGWGPGDPIRTLCEYNLNALEWPDGQPDAEGWVAAWSQAFDVEKVTKRFYDDYAAVFKKVEKLIGKQMELKGDDLRMFTQTLFNRLMFLRFMERKAWLTFGGRKDYLRALYAAGGWGKKSFYKGRLCPLFFEGLAVEGQQQSEAYGGVPYLNGGLFERSELDKQVTDLPDEVFEGILADEHAGGLFYRYNFTVEESTPLDIEVAVDPEMLGKVFEELVTGRHESGSYYTPRPVVAFMCREALKGYLSDKTKASTEAVATLVDHQDAGKLKETHAREILAALDDLKAVDPACGSGAYLLGLLQEMIVLYRLLYSEKLVKDARTLYDLKLRIISTSLYGVDIDPFATNIAKLRLWLSLAVEADKPVPLPNLDFKIETGDSLLAPNPQELPDLFRVQLQRAADVLVMVKNQFFLSQGDEKESYRETIISQESKLRESLAAEDGEEVVDWRIQFAEVFANKRGGFDMVLANPPYVNMVEMDATDPDYRNRVRVQFESTSGGFDLFVPFMERGCQLLRRGGSFSYIVPNKVLSAEYAKSLRRYFAQHMKLLSLTDLSHIPVFSAAVYPFIIIAEKTAARVEDAWVDIYGTTGRSLDDVGIEHKARSSMEVTVSMKGRWSPLVEAASSGKLGAAIRQCPTLEALADVSGAATVSEAYEWKDAVIDDGESLLKRSPKRYARFIVSGNVRRHYHTWYDDNVQYIKYGYRRPVLDKQHEAISGHRVRQIEAAKLIISGMSKRPTCVWDTGGIAAGKSTVIVIPKTKVDGNYLAAVMNSETMAEVYKMLFGSLSLSGGYLRFGPPQVKALPIPEASATEQRALASLAQKCECAKGIGCEAWEKEIDQRVAALFGL